MGAAVHDAPINLSLPTMELLIICGWRRNRVYACNISVVFI
jgi:hypothetical protein